jgi:hypothetical protein
MRDTNLDYAQMSDTELREVAAAIAAELTRRGTATLEPQRYAVLFGGYNARRYSRPWIARVTAWPVGKQAELEFGSFIGDDDGGVVEISARPGDILRWGQRDNRGRGAGRLQAGLTQLIGGDK